MISEKQKRMLQVINRYGHMDVSLMELIDDDFIDLMHKDYISLSRTYTGVVVRLDPVKEKAVKEIIDAVS